ncbi:MAG: DUF1127 domain-containing protein [Acidisphaera sp.]|nr:DUF1127 domain-containing protein [Acidisphaera sp.]MBV9813056.1 DUF1127 domain-containing protein [Acetobacteraceae bacterium]
MFANNIIALHRGTLPRPARTPRLQWRRVLDAVGRVVEAQRTRRFLAEADDRTLHDIGISRAQAQYIASRPIWDLDD